MRTCMRRSTSCITSSTLTTYPEGTPITWNRFTTAFRGNYIPPGVVEMKVGEFMRLSQGTKSEEGIAVDPSKVQEVMDWNAPTSVSEVRSFLGLSGYYRRFIPDFYKISKPMTSLLQKDRKFVWTEGCELAFRTLRKLLTTAPVLQNLIQRSLLMCFVTHRRVAWGVC